MISIETGLVHKFQRGVGPQGLEKEGFCGNSVTSLEEGGWRRNVEVASTFSMVKE